MSGLRGGDSGIGCAIMDDIHEWSINKIKPELEITVIFSPYLRGFNVSSSTLESKRSLFHPCLLMEAFHMRRCSGQDMVPIIHVGPHYSRPSPFMTNVQLQQHRHVVSQCNAPCEALSCDASRLFHSTSRWCFRKIIHGRL